MQKYLPIVITFSLIALFFSFNPTNIQARNRRPRLIAPTAPSIRIRPTVTPTQTPSTPTPTLKPTVTPPIPTPTKGVTSNTLDIKQQFMMNEINNYRQENGLKPVMTDSYTCAFAQLRAQEITNDFSHAGFTSRINSHTLPYPSYHYINENIAETPNYQEVITLWKNSSGHAANMRADITYACVGYMGNYYSMEGWKP